MMKKHTYKPESLMMSHGYNPAWSEGSIKPPIFQTSTFVFDSAEAGKSFFEVAYGLREKSDGEKSGLIYSRINNPNLEMLESRLCLWDQAEACAVFESGMSAISSVLLEYLKPGDILLYSTPTYGGTDHFINEYLPHLGIESIGFSADQTASEIINSIEISGRAHKLAFIFIETPANPTNDLFDIELYKQIADHFSTPSKKVTIGVDNTFMGPLWSHPLDHGADLVLYSATKYIGGHSDLIAGAVLGNHDDIKRLKNLRTFLGNMPSPHTGWLLLRSLETLKVRMEQQAFNAQMLANYLITHQQIHKVHYLGCIDKGTSDYYIYKKQYSSPGAMLAFEISGGEKEAFQFLNQLKLIKLAVSLGSTESLVQHPATMTHAGMSHKAKQKMGIKDNLIRISVGIEHYEDLIEDIEQSLAALSANQNMVHFNKIFELSN